MDPFGVREVLQVVFTVSWHYPTVSIPLKSGRCCKSILNHDSFVGWSQSL